MKTGQLHASLMLQDFAAAISNIISSPPWLNIHLILQESADVTCTLPHDPPTSPIGVTR